MTPEIDDKQAFVERLLKGLEARATARGESERHMATRLGSSEGLFKNLRSGSMPTVERLDVILKELGETLTLGARPSAKPAGQVLSVELDGDDYAVVPRFDVELSAGDGRMNHDAAAAGSIAFRRDWMAREGIPADQSIVVRVKGDSMAPTLTDGDLVLIDLRRTQPTGRKIYALIGPDGDARVKRLEHLPDALILHSDNPDHPTELIPAHEAANVRILGEVVWWGHTVKK